MAKKRRTSTNKTGISRIKGISNHDAWVAYSCLYCRKLNYEKIGQELFTPEIAFETQEWTCSSCQFTHSKDSKIPLNNWQSDISNPTDMPTYRFWQGFFRSATEGVESYWKQCNACARILPFSHFSKHQNWGPLERQIECRACKGAINAVLNPKRTRQQLHESSIKRRIADLFTKQFKKNINIEQLFKRFKSKCFKTKKQLNINDRNTWHIDHILPSLYLWPLTKENAALLSVEANTRKKAKWPSQFYNNNELIDLAKITGANLNILSLKKPLVNPDIDVNFGVQKWLKTRNHSHLKKKIDELKQILKDYDLVSHLNPQNKKILGYK